MCSSLTVGGLDILMLIVEFNFRDEDTRAFVFIQH